MSDIKVIPCRFCGARPFVEKFIYGYSAICTTSDCPMGIRFTPLVIWNKPNPAEVELRLRVTELESKNEMLTDDLGTCRKVYRELHANYLDKDKHDYRMMQIVIEQYRRINELEWQTRWIPAGERLPEKDAAFPQFSVTVFAYSGITRKIYKDAFYVFYKDNVWDIGWHDFGLKPIHDISHFMLYPIPPEVKE